jgi:hypothetical protein
MEWAALLIVKLPDHDQQPLIIRFLPVQMNVVVWEQYYR